MAKFDMSRAWNDAVAMVKSNREVLMVVAGVFFLLPTLVLTLLFADEQAQAMATMQQMMTSGTAGTSPTAGPATGFFIASAVAGIVQLVGFMTLLALFDDNVRPTVAEAGATALRSLPTLIGAVLLFVIGYLVMGLVFGLIAGGLGAALGAGWLVAILMVPFIVGVFYVMTKLSLTLAVIILERQTNPMAALKRSWALTKGNSVMLFTFYMLLVIVYLVISILISGVLMGLVMLALGSGPIGLIVVGVVSGLVGAAANVIFTGVIASVHRQLAGASPGGLGDTFS